MSSRSARADAVAADREEALGLARAAASRDLATAGIPVVLALAGADGPLPASSDPAARADGARLANRARSLRTALWPDAREDDMFVTYAVLATVGFAELEPGVGFAELEPGVGSVELDGPGER